ncbi:MAG TPA: biotin/lipoyl-containing protein [Ktedonobacterales bacterium]
MRYVVMVGERAITIETPEPGDEARRASVDDVDTAVDWRALGGPVTREVDGARIGHYSLLAGEASYDLFVRDLGISPDGAGERLFEVTVGGHTHTMRLRDERSRALQQLTGGGHHSGDAAIRAPMPGLVSRVLAEEGQSVARGQAVVILEAMKMENDLATPRAGVVKSMRVKNGQTVNQGDTLVVIGDAPDQAGGAADDDDTSSEIAD